MKVTNQEDIDPKTVPESIYISSNKPTASKLYSLGSKFRARAKSSSSAHSLQQDQHSKKDSNFLLNNEVSTPRLAYWQKMKDRCQSVFTFFNVFH